MKSIIAIIATIVASLMLGGCVYPNPYGTMSAQERFEFEPKYEAFLDQHRRMSSGTANDNDQIPGGPPMPLTEAPTAGKKMP
jgi:hypothetical protein